MQLGRGYAFVARQQHPSGCWIDGYISACMMKLGGEEGFLFGGALVWKRETYKKRLLCARTREKGENLDLSGSKRLDDSLERRTGVEPASQPWEGRILPLN